MLPPSEVISADNSLAVSAIALLALIQATTLQERTVICTLLLSAPLRPTGLKNESLTGIVVVEQTIILAHPLGAALHPQYPSSLKALHQYQAQQQQHSPALLFLEALQRHRLRQVRLKYLQRRAAFPLLLSPASLVRLLRPLAPPRGQVQAVPLHLFPLVLLHPRAAVLHL